MASEDTPATTPPLFTQAELSGSTAPGTASLDWTTILALFAFVGTVVRCPPASVARRSPPLTPKLVALAAKARAVGVKRAAYGESTTRRSSKMASSTFLAFFGGCRCSRRKAKMFSVDGWLHGTCHAAAATAKQLRRAGTACVCAQDGCDVPDAADDELAALPPVAFDV